MKFGMILSHYLYIDSPGFRMLFCKRNVKIDKKNERNSEEILQALIEFSHEM